MKWTKINTEKDLPSNIHFRNHTEYWASVKGIVFKIYFYNSYGGKKYSIAEYNSNNTYKKLKQEKINPMDEALKLDAYMKILRPEPFNGHDLI